MICGNCRTDVDNDLIFCTNCGVRINETWSKLTSSNSIETKVFTQQQLPKGASNIKWIALIIALIALPTSLFFGYIFLKKDSPQTAQNSNKSTNINPAPTRKPANKSTNAATPTNQNINSANTETNSANSNLNNLEDSKTNEIKIDRLEIAPQSHTACPFEIDSDTAKIIGKIKISDGENLLGYVYTQEAYDEHFPDPIHKMFSFEGDKNIAIEQTLLKGKYVFVFINETEKNVVIEGNFEIK